MKYNLTEEEMVANILTGRIWRVTEWRHKKIPGSGPGARGSIYRKSNQYKIIGNHLSKEEAYELYNECRTVLDSKERWSKRYHVSEYSKGRYRRISGGA